MIFLLLYYLDYIKIDGQQLLKVIQSELALQLADHISRNFSYQPSHKDYIYQTQTQDYLYLENIYHLIYQRGT